MKSTLVLIFMMVISVTALSQSNKIASLDAKNGFRSIKLLSPITVFPDMVFIREDSYYQKIYKRRNEDLRIGDIQVDQILYKFFDGYLYEIEIVDSGTRGNIGGKLLDMLTELYGQPSYDPLAGQYWNGSKVYLKLNSDLNYHRTNLTYQSSDWLKAYQAVKSSKSNKFKNDL